MGRQRGVWFVGLGLLCGCPERPLAAAEAHLAAGDPKAAGAAFVDAAKRDPANLAAWDGAIDAHCVRRVDVGDCLNVLDLELQILGDLQRHRDVLSEVLERRARERLTAGMADAALADLARAEKAAPNRAVIHAIRARVYLSLGRRAEALESIRRAKTIDPRLEETDRIISELPPPDEAFGGEAP